jgi:hypothetical protein
MESLKNLLPNRNFTIPPQWLFVGQFALVFGALTLGVLWLITPPPSPLSQVQTVATTSRSSTFPALRPSAPASEVSDPEEQATTQTTEPPVSETEAAAPATETAAVPLSTPVTQTVAAPPPYIPSTPSTLTKTLAPPEALPELVSIASNGTQKFAVLQLGNAVQTVGVADRIGPWQVTQIRSAQVTIQQGKRVLALSFGGSTGTSPTANSNSYSRPTPTFQPPSEENRVPQPPPQPPQIDNNPDGNPENENPIDR